MSGARDLWVTVRCGCALGTRERVAHMSHGRQVECRAPWARCEASAVRDVRAQACCVLGSRRSSSNPYAQTQQR